MISTHLDNVTVWRVNATLHKPIFLFEIVSSAAEFAALDELEAAHAPSNNPTHLLPTLPRSEWVFGPGCGHIMVPFTYLRPSRFSSGAFGVFYAGLEQKTAIREVAYHRGLFMASTCAHPEILEEQILHAKVQATVPDIRDEQGALRRTHASSEIQRHPEWYSPEVTAYAPAQMLGAALQGAGHPGLAYASVRRPGGSCVGIFKPKAIISLKEGRHFSYLWDGEKIAGWA